MTSEGNEPIENGICPSNRLFERPLIETNNKKKNNDVDDDDEDDGDDDDYNNMAYKDSTLHDHQLIHHLEPTTPPLLSDAVVHHVVGCGSHKYTRLVRVPIEWGMVPVRSLLSSCLRDIREEIIVEHEKMKEYTIMGFDK